MAETRKRRLADKERFKAEGSGYIRAGVNRKSDINQPTVKR
jgi:hypothetical protein